MVSGKGEESRVSLVYHFTERQFLLTEMQLRSLLDKSSHSRSFHKYVDGLIAFSSGVAASLAVALVTVKGPDYQSIGAISGQSIHSCMALLFWVAVAALPALVLAKRFKGKFLSSTDDAIRELVGKSDSVPTSGQKKLALGVPITMGEIPSPTNEVGNRTLPIQLDSSKIELQSRPSSDDLEDVSDGEARVSLESSTNSEIIRKAIDGAGNSNLDGLQRKILEYMAENGLSDVARIGEQHEDKKEVLGALIELDRQGLIGVDGTRVVITAQGRILALS